MQTSIFNQNKYHKRNIQTNANPDFSLISGNGTTTFHAKENVQVVVTTYDCFNNSLTIGGSQLTLELTELDSNNNTISVTNSSFTDNNDGTYSINYTATQEGYVSYNIHISGNCTV